MDSQDGGSFFKVKSDNVYVYNRMPSATEIVGLYNGSRL
jgi:hypothetical protein